MDDILKNIFGGGFSEGSGSGFHGFGGFGNSGSGRTRTSGRSYESSGFGNGFGNHGFGGGGNFRQDGSDVTAEIDVTFDEAAFGGDKVIRLSDAQGSNAAGKITESAYPGQRSVTEKVSVCVAKECLDFQEARQEICC